MTEAEIADQYTKQQYIDYGDLNEKAEAQIRKAFSDGMTQTTKSPTQAICSKRCR